MKIKPRQFLPVEIVFHPNWWNKNYELDFTWDFFFNPQTRVAAEQKMSRILHEKFGQFGYGAPNPKPEPIIGPVHLAAGFMISALWGCQIVYYPDASPQVVARNMKLEDLDKKPIPDPAQCKEFVALLLQHGFYIRKHLSFASKVNSGWRQIMHLMSTTAMMLFGEEY